MKNTAIGKVFCDIGDLLELKGENPFKMRAYQRAARAIEHLARRGWCQAGDIINTWPLEKVKAFFKKEEG